MIDGFGAALMDVLMRCKNRQPAEDVATASVPCGDNQNYRNDADEAAAMLEPAAKNQASEAIDWASVRAVGILEILWSVGSRHVPFDELLSKLHRELKNGPADALALISLCPFGWDTARRHRELATAVSGVIGSQNCYNRKNGSRDKKCQLIEVWKSGKYDIAA